MDKLLAGEAPTSHGPFWLLRIGRYREPGVGHIAAASRLDAMRPSMRAVGGRVVFKLLRSARTLVSGDGAIPKCDVVLLLAFPSPAALQAMRCRYDYVRRVAATPSPLIDVMEFTFRGAWTGGSARRDNNTGVPALLPLQQTDNDNKLLARAQHLAADKARDPRRMRAIMGNAEDFLPFLSDDRFACPNARLWMLNLLRREDNDFYVHYGRRAAAHIGSGKTGGKGGLCFTGDGVHTLRGGENFHHIACMEYPSRQAFLKFVMGQNGTGRDDDSHRHDDEGAVRYSLRTAGLAMQGLICLVPDAEPFAVEDPQAPVQARM